MLQVVGEAGPQQFGLNFPQTAHVKLPQAQLALDPGVAKFHDSSATAILGLCFRAGHLFPEGLDRRTFHPPNDSAASPLIFRTAPIGSNLAPPHLLIRRSRLKRAFKPASNLMAQHMKIV
jgi:hypothetical protein